MTYTAASQQVVIHLFLMTSIFMLHSIYLRSWKSELGMTSHLSLYGSSLEVKKPVLARLATNSNTSLLYFSHTGLGLVRFVRLSKSEMQLQGAFQMTKMKRQTKTKLAFSPFLNVQISTIFSLFYHSI